MAKAKALRVDQLFEGWTFKQTDDTTKDAWMPVKKVPTNVHLDLMDNGKYVVTFGMLDRVWQ
jgi:beta-mannosidase